MTATDSKETAAQFLDKFGFKEKLNEALNKRDNSLVPILTANLAIFGVTLAILFATSGSRLTAAVLLIGISAVLALLSGLLNIWYLIRIEVRKDFFKKEQERVFQKTETKLVTMFDLFKKIIKSNITQLATLLKEKGESADQISDRLKDESSLELFVEAEAFTAMTIMELSLKETLINADRCFEEELTEKYPSLKLFLDQMSDKTKKWGLAISSAFVLAAVLVKFVVGS